MLAAFLLLFSSIATSPVQAAPPIPPPPRYYVLDEPHVLSPGALRSVQSLLIEHDHLTGQQILVAIFNSLGDEDLNERTNLVFQNWKIGQRGQDNGTLLAIYWKEHKARIEVGYGLEDVLTDAKSKNILEDQLVPAMKDGDPDRAVSLTVIEILKTLQSPLTENGRAQQILNNHERSEVRRWNEHRPRSGYTVWIILGLFALVIVFNTITSADAHFTSAGWYRPKPWRKRWGRDDLGPPGGFWGGFGGGGGGGFGGWGGSGGGGGGFSGGGGSSGGGGASAGW